MAPIFWDEEDAFETKKVALPTIIFSRVAQNLIARGVAPDVLPQGNVIAADHYLERLVMELAGQYSNNGEAWFREHFKEHIG